MLVLAHCIACLVCPHRTPTTRHLTPVTNCVYCPLELQLWLLLWLLLWASHASTHVHMMIEPQPLILMVLAFGKRHSGTLGGSRQKSIVSTMEMSLVCLCLSASKRFLLTWMPEMSSSWGRSEWSRDEDWMGRGGQGLPLSKFYLTAAPLGKFLSSFFTP